MASLDATEVTFNGAPSVVILVEQSESSDDIFGETPTASVVADCAKRWFHEILKEAKAGDAAMQVLVGQMYYSGYGVSRNPKKVCF
ncbi:hypothetical protein PIB30_030926 [Stylosanthes scabra]|uniref:Uncharacterized protein n=1 Tax=Stylosanthes scabra TaxID=79078 RepID=A0ABU6QB84_9FABA|nr:hypothetical protein [Stylosanthes scabra]